MSERNREPNWEHYVIPGQQSRGKWPATDEQDWVFPRLRRRLDAYARDAVTHGDMTPAAARMLALILDAEGVRDG